MARLFVAVRPPAESVPGVTNPHITLCFLGDVPDGSVDEVADALRAGLAGTTACEACVEAGTPRRLGPTAIVRPVTGLDDLARVVRAVVGGYAARPEDRPFRGHLTVARRRRGEPAPGDGQAAGSDSDRSGRPSERQRAGRRWGDGGAAPEPVPDELRWRVEEVVLVRSALGRGPGGTARHDDVTVVPLGAG